MKISVGRFLKLIKLCTWVFLHATSSMLLFKELAFSRNKLSCYKINDLREDLATFGPYARPILIESFNDTLFMRDVDESMRFSFGTYFPLWLSFAKFFCLHNNLINFKIDLMKMLVGIVLNCNKLPHSKHSLFPSRTFCIW